MADLEFETVKSGLINTAGFQAARDEAARSGDSFWLSLARLGFASPDRITAFLARQSGLPFVDIGAYRLSRTVVSLVPRDFCFHHYLIPLFLMGKSLCTAFCNPLDAGLVDTVAKISGYEIDPCAASGNAIRSALLLYWDIGEKDFEMAQFASAPQKIKGFTAGRRSNRVTVHIPAVVHIEEGSQCQVRGRIEGETQDIAADGESMGLKIPVFLPRGLTVTMVVRAQSGDIQTTGTVAQIRMTGENEYSTGIVIGHDDTRSRSLLCELVRTRDTKKNTA